MSYLAEMDLLQMKLECGVQVKTFFPDYSGSNEYEGEPNRIAFE